MDLPPPEERCAPEERPALDERLPPEEREFIDLDPDDLLDVLRDDDGRLLFEALLD
jgi:hypothetical protein